MRRSWISVATLGLIVLVVALLAGEIGRRLAEHWRLVLGWGVLLAVMAGCALVAWVNAHRGDGDTRVACEDAAAVALGPAPECQPAAPQTEMQRQAALMHAQAAARTAVRAGWAAWVVAQATADAANEAEATRKVRA